MDPSNPYRIGWNEAAISAEFAAMVEARHKEFGRRVRAARSAKNWTQMDLAHRSGISINTISDIEIGKRAPRSHTAKSLSKALGVKVTDLLPAATLDVEQERRGQLDRIEDKLDALLEAITEPAQPARRVRARASEAAQRRAGSPATKPRTRRAAGA